SFNVLTAPQSCLLSLHAALPIFLIGVGNIMPACECMSSRSHVERPARGPRRTNLLWHRRPGYMSDAHACRDTWQGRRHARRVRRDRKSTRLNSSHVKISYAVFCL